MEDEKHILSDHVHIIGQRHPCCVLFVRETEYE